MGGNSFSLLVAAKHTSTPLSPRQNTWLIVLCYCVYISISHCTQSTCSQKPGRVSCMYTCDCVTCIPVGRVYSLHRPITLGLLGKLGSPWPGVCCAGQLIVTANSNWSPMTDSMATKDRGWLQRHWGKSIVSLVACCHTESHTLDGRPLVVNTTCRSASLCEPGALEHKTGCLYNPTFGMFGVVPNLLWYWMCVCVCVCVCVW